MAETAALERVIGRLIRRIAVLQAALVAEGVLTPAVLERIDTAFELELTLVDSAIAQAFERESLPPA